MNELQQRDRPGAMKRAFTLIELLVVVTIIVILLAMLAPALDKAIYQAALAECSGKLKAMASGVTQYTFENRRYYPDRGLATRGYRDANPLPVNPHTVKRFSIGYDMRPIHRNIFPLNKTLQCPLSPQINLENYDATSEDVGLAASYEMFWGWQYKHETKTFAGMFKYGDRFAYDEILYPTDRVNRFNVLAGDMDLVWAGGQEAANPAQTSHPDRSRLMFELLAEEEWFIERSSVGRWWGPLNRGLIDNNYAFDDGAVARYTDVPPVHVGPNHPLRTDKSLTRVPINFNNYNNRGVARDKMHIPLR